MSPEEFYRIIEKLAKDVVPAGEAQEKLLLDIACARESRPADPPAKYLLANLTDIADASLFSAAQSTQIKEIVHNWI